MIEHIAMEKNPSTFKTVNIFVEAWYYRRRKSIWRCFYFIMHGWLGIPITPGKKFNSIQLADMLEKIQPYTAESREIQRKS